MDPDAPVRAHLLNSARELGRQTGPVTAILLSGDIAFKGDQVEFDEAKRWLVQLSSAVQCKPENIFMVPGNHDCDRRIIEERPDIGDIQAAIRTTDQRWRDRELWHRLLKDNSRDALIAPIAAYNRFAAPYGCDVFPPERLFWTAKFPLSEGFELHLRGINSTFLSGPQDAKGRLLVSSLQTAFSPTPRVVHAAMLHHPPDWLVEGDSDAVDDALREGTRLHFLGHKHRQRIQQVDTHIRLSAGAVNPDRADDGWLPGYNVMCIDVIRRDGRFALRAKTTLMDWQSAPDGFRPRKTPQGAEIFEHSIDLGAVEVEAKPAAVATTIAIESEAPPPMREAGVHLPEAAVNEQSTRNLIFRFWNLSASERREITMALGLLEKADLELPEAERYRRVFEKAKALNLVDELAKKVTEREATNK